MNVFIRYITNIIVGLFKRMWYHIKMAELKKELKIEEEEANEAKQNSDRTVDEFESAYELYKQQREAEKNAANSDKGNDK